MKKSEFKRQGLATLKAGGRARAKRPKGLWPSEDPEAVGQATETELSLFLEDVPLMIALKERI